MSNRYNELLKLNLNKACEMAAELNEYEAAYLAGQLSGIMACRAGLIDRSDKRGADDKSANSRTA